jgi:DNA replication protein DnaC
MAKALVKKRGPHDSSCHLNNPSVDEKLRKSCSCGNNPLNEADFIRMRVPRHLWEATLAKVPESVRESVAGYLRNIRKAKDGGGSLLVYGKPGVGKTGVAVVVLKEARAWGYTTYTTTTAELREAIRAHTTYDYETSVYSWCQTVDFLVLDDVSSTDATEKFFTLSDIRGLLLSRQDRGLITLVTSAWGVPAWRDAKCADFAEALYKSCIALEVTGADLRKEAVKAKNEFLK